VNWPAEKFTIKGGIKAHGQSDRRGGKRVKKKKEGGSQENWEDTLSGVRQIIGPERQDVGKSGMLREGVASSLQQNDKEGEEKGPRGGRRRVNFSCRGLWVPWSTFKTSGKKV